MSSVRTKGAISKCAGVTRAPGGMGDVDRDGRNSLFAYGKSGSFLYRGTGVAVAPFAPARVQLRPPGDADSGPPDRLTRLARRTGHPKDGGAVLDPAGAADPALLGWFLTKAR
ncbi:hypothetical protein ABZ946_37130 [Streptomyces sp. NPDC046324]|uniref:hypothetical protein n=1 Tax=Streptomyces sp. NPDC046324 TaxID=3154915 RepID=UPI0033FC52CF